MGLLVLVIAIGLSPALDSQVSEPPAPRFHLEVATGIRYPGKAGESGEALRWARPRTGTWRALVAGKTIELATFMSGSTCGFITGGRTFSAAATFGWRLTATPVTLAQDHALVRVKWSREIIDGSSSGDEPSEMLMLLRPGEVASLDSTVLKNAPVTQCRNALVTLFVALKETEPYRDRVVSTDLWLVHRLPDGQERTQLLNVRGGFNQTMPFTFDDISVGADVLDVSGELTPRSVSDGAIRLEFQAQRRWSRGSAFPDTLVVGGGTVVLPMKPLDVTSITIPLASRPGFLIGSGTRAVAPLSIEGHSLSIRVRSRQIR